MDRRDLEVAYLAVAVSTVRNRIVGVPESRRKDLFRNPIHDKLEIVRDGEVVASQPAVAQREAVLEREIPLTRGGWLAARIAGGGQTYAMYTVYAHSSPVYTRVPGTLSAARGRQAQ